MPGILTPGDSIGAACALQLAAEGCDLALTYSSSKGAAESLVEKIKATYPLESRKMTIHKADMGVPDEVVKMCEAVRSEHGRGVEVLVANAGYGKRIRDVSDIPLEEFEYTINVNLRAPFLCVKGVVDDMKAANWGRIIFMGSIAAFGGGVNVRYRPPFRPPFRPLARLSSSRTITARLPPPPELN